MRSPPKKRCIECIRDEEVWTEKDTEMIKVIHQNIELILKVQKCRQQLSFSKLIIMN